jgi:DNA polymerase-1
MIRVDAGLRQMARGALLLTVHDELVFEVEEAAVGLSRLGQGEMEAVYALRVPLVVDVGSGPTWGSAH